MAATAVKLDSVKEALNRSKEGEMADAMKKLALGSMLDPVVKSVSQSAALTIALDPPAMMPAMVSVRVTAGAAAAGARLVSDSGATPSATVCSLSADGALLTFEGNVTGAELVYMQKPASALDSAFASL